MRLPLPVRWIFFHPHPVTLCAPHTTLVMFRAACSIAKSGPALPSFPKLLIDRDRMLFPQDTSRKRHVKHFLSDTERRAKKLDSRTNGQAALLDGAASDALDEVIQEEVVGDAHRNGHYQRTGHE